MTGRLRVFVLLAVGLFASGLAFPPSGYALDTLAITGTLGQVGSAPGQFNEPVDVTLDLSGNVIVPDTNNNRVQKLRRDGTVIWVRGKADNTAGNGNGEFNRPKDAAVAADGTVLVADADNNRVVRLDANGSFLNNYKLTFAPQGISVDQGDGSIWLADSPGNRVVKLNAAGAVVKTVGTVGTQPGQFDSPFDVSVAGGFVYVADGGNHRVQKFRTDGGFVKTWGQMPVDQAHPKPGDLSRPNGISATAEGRVFVVDRELALVDEYTSDGGLTERFGHKRLLEQPGGLYARGDDLAIADTGHSQVFLLTHALAAPAGSFCDSATGTCETGPNGVPSVVMPRGDRSDVRFVTPSDACQRLGRGTNLGKDAFFNGKKYPVVPVTEGFQVTILRDDLVSGSVIISWKCPITAGASALARHAGFNFSVINENVGDVTLYDPSGLVLDARTRRGIPDATVTLSSAPSIGGPFGFADPLSISPRVNPERTDRRGHYGWDVPNGYYRIRVTRFGYRTLRASRIVHVPPAVTNLNVRLRRNPAEQARLIDPRGAVGRLRLGMARTVAQRIARSLRPRPRLGFRRGRLVRIDVRSSRFRTGASIGPGSTERTLHLAYGRGARRFGRGRHTSYQLGRVSFLVPRANGARGRITVARIGK